MNDVYFFCEHCRTCIEAGYRRAVFALESCGLVPADLLGSERTFAPIDAAGVLSCEPYWDASTLDPATAEQVARARIFVVAHAAHALSFGDMQRVLRPGVAWWEWMDEDGVSAPTPRFLAEGLRLARWEQVESHFAAARRPPWWWGTSRTRRIARLAFERSVRSLA